MILTDPKFWENLEVILRILKPYAAATAAMQSGSGLALGEAVRHFVCFGFSIHGPLAAGILSAEFAYVACAAYNKRYRQVRLVIVSWSLD